VADDEAVQGVPDDGQAEQDGADHGHELGLVGRVEEEFGDKAVDKEDAAHESAQE